MGSLTRWIRACVPSSDFVTDQRAWVLLVTDIAAFVLGAGILLASDLFRTMPLGLSTQISVLAVLMGSLASIVLLRSGNYRLAAHITVSVTMLAIWYVNIRNAAEIDAKTDTVYIVAALVLPALLLSRVCTIVHGVISLAVIGYITVVLNRVAGAKHDMVVGFAVDNSVAIIFVVFFTSVISRIYERALDRVGRLLGEQQEANEDLTRMGEMIAQSESQKRQFYRDTIFSITDGKLSICDESEVCPVLASAQIEMELPDPASVSRARHRVRAYFEEQGLVDERLETFIIALGEAMTNAVKHAVGGRVYAGRTDDSVWAAIKDQGRGIESLTLPKAVLLRGFSTKASLGLGYCVILGISDRVLLKTDETGTTIVLYERLRPATPEVSIDSLPDTWAQTSPSPKA